MKPCYLRLMNANIVHDSPEEQARFAVLFKAALPKYRDADLEAMLRSSWRPSKVAAWVVAARRDRSFLPLLAERATESPQHAEHLLIALTVLGGNEGADAVTDYLRQILPPGGTAWPIDEAVRPDDALAALALLDRRLGTDRASEFLNPDGPWDQFVESAAASCPESWRNRVVDAWNDRLEASRRDIPAAVDFIETYLSPGSP